MARRFQKLFPEARQSWEKMNEFRGYLDTVKVNLMQPCETYPSLNMDEHCRPNLNTNYIVHRLIEISTFQTRLNWIQPTDRWKE